MTAPTTPVPQRGTSGALRWAAESGRALAVPVGSVIFAFLVGGVIVAVTGGNPIAAYQGLACGGLGLFCTNGETPAYQISTTINSVGAAGMAAGMCILSGLAVGFASAAGFVFRRQKRLSGLLLLAIAGAFMSYSMANCVGFVASQSLAKAKLTEARRQQNSDLAGLQNQQAIETQNWLRRDLPTDQGQGREGQTACAGSGAG